MREQYSATRQVLPQAANGAVFKIHRSNNEYTSSADIDSARTYHSNPGFDIKVQGDSLICQSGRKEHRSLMLPLGLGPSKELASDFLWSCVESILRVLKSRGRENPVFELSGWLPDFLATKDCTTSPRLQSLPLLPITDPALELHEN